MQHFFCNRHKVYGLLVRQVVLTLNMLFIFFSTLTIRKKHYFNIIFLFYLCIVVSIGNLIKTIQKLWAKYNKTKSVRDIQQKSSSSKSQIKDWKTVFDFHTLRQSQNDYFLWKFAACVYLRMYDLEWNDVLFIPDPSIKKQ